MDTSTLKSTPTKRWEYRPEWAAWWIMVDDGGPIAYMGYGPFNATEAVWAGEVHGIKFRAAAALAPQGVDE